MNSKTSRSQKCCICSKTADHRNNENKNTDVFVTDCTHYYHKDCLLDWINCKQIKKCHACHESIDKTYYTFALIYMHDTMYKWKNRDRKKKYRLSLWNNQPAILSQDEMIWTVINTQFFYDRLKLITLIDMEYEEFVFTICRNIVYIFENSKHIEEFDEKMCNLFSSVGSLIQKILNFDWSSEDVLCVHKK